MKVDFTAKLNTLGEQICVRENSNILHNVIGTTFNVYSLYIIYVYLYIDSLSLLKKLRVEWIP